MSTMTFPDAIDAFTDMIEALQVLRQYAQAVKFWFADFADGFFDGCPKELEMYTRQVREDAVRDTFGEGCSPSDAIEMKEEVFAMVYQPILDLVHPEYYDTLTAFLNEASDFAAPPRFLEAAAYAVTWHTDMAERVIREDRELAPVECEAYLDLADAALWFPNPLAAAGVALRTIVGHAMNETIETYFAARDADLLVEPRTVHAFGTAQPCGSLPQLHRRTNARSVADHWGRIIQVIQGCPDSDRGRAFRRDLEQRARAMFRRATSDFARYRTELGHPLRTCEPPSVIEMSTTYAVLGARLDQVLVLTRGDGFGL